MRLARRVRQHLEHVRALAVVPRRSRRARCARRAIPSATWARSASGRSGPSVLESRRGLSISLGAVDELDPHAFQVRRANVRGVDLAYLREGEGGFPLVLLHGWPETMRIWWRNVQPLADAGFEVIVPGPARVRRVWPAARRLLRRGRAGARHRGARAAGAWARPRSSRAAATSGAWWRRSWRSASTASSTGRSCSTRSPPLLRRRVRGGWHFA